MAQEAHAAAEAMTAGDYIVHHLQFLRNREQGGIVDFGVVNLDSIFWSVVLGLVCMLLLWSVARSMKSGVPGRMQAAIEILVEMVHNQAKAIVHNEQSRRFVAPLALVSFLWIFLMNAMDLLPVDLLPRIWTAAYAAAGHDPHHAYLRVVPSADLSVTFGMSVCVLLVSLYYAIKLKGFGGWFVELLTAPFHAHSLAAKILLMPFNLLLQLIEYFAKTMSHGMRLFGNMFAGELVFMLIALLGAAAGASATGVLLPLLHVVFGTLWAIFHILIITLQAFIFMMLTLVYIGQAHEKH